MCAEKCLLLLFGSLPIKATNQHSSLELPNTVLAALSSGCLRHNGPGMADSRVRIRFQATLFRPGGKDQGGPWTFLNLPDEASQELPSRGMVSVDGALEGHEFQATLRPDGNGGHWLKVPPDLRAEAGIEVGQAVTVELTPSLREPEPEVPEDLVRALAEATPEVQEVWRSLTPLARRDWAQWVESAKREETRRKRAESACDMLASGKRRPCCFDRSGMYSKSLCGPVPDTAEAE